MIGTILTIIAIIFLTNWALLGLCLLFEWFELRNVKPENPDDLIASKELARQQMRKRLGLPTE